MQRCRCRGADAGTEVQRWWCMFMCICMCMCRQLGAGAGQQQVHVQRWCRGGDNVHLHDAHVQRGRGRVRCRYVDVQRCVGAGVVGAGVGAGMVQVQR